MAADDIPEHEITDQNIFVGSCASRRCLASGDHRRGMSKIDKNVPPNRRAYTLDSTASGAADASSQIPQ